MKLYATITSERASKGQGGNKYVEIELKAFDRDTPIGTILLETQQDATGQLNQYILKWQDNTTAHADEWMILLEGHKDEGVIQHAETKGKKKKDETQ